MDKDAAATTYLAGTGCSIRSKTLASWGCEPARQSCSLDHNQDISHIMNLSGVDATCLFALDLKGWMSNQIPQGRFSYTSCGRAPEKQLTDSHLVPYAKFPQPHLSPPHTTPLPCVGLSLCPFHKTWPCRDAVENLGHWLPFC